MDTGAEWSIPRRYGREIRFGNEYLFKDGIGTYQYQFAAIGENCLHFGNEYGRLIGEWRSFGLLSK